MFQEKNILFCIHSDGMYTQQTLALLYTGLRNHEWYLVQSLQFGLSRSPFILFHHWLLKSKKWKIPETNNELQIPCLYKQHREILLSMLFPRTVTPLSTVAMWTSISGQLTQFTYHKCYSTSLYLQFCLLVQSFAMEKRYGGRALEMYPTFQRSLQIQSQRS